MVTLAARASRIENQDAIDAAIVGMLADPKEVRKPVPTNIRISLGFLEKLPPYFNNTSISCMKW